MSDNQETQLEAAKEELRKSDTNKDYKKAAKKKRKAEEEALLDEEWEKLPGDLVPDDLDEWAAPFNRLLAVCNDSLVKQYWNPEAIKEICESCGEEEAADQRKKIRKLKAIDRFANQVKGRNTNNEKGHSTVKENGDDEEQPLVIHNGDYGDTANEIMELRFNNNIVCFHDELHHYDDAENCWQRTEGEDNENRFLSSHIRTEVKAVKKIQDDYEAVTPTTSNIKEITETMKDICVIMRPIRGYDTWCNGMYEDTDDEFLPVENGILNLVTRELLPHTADYFSKTKIPTLYDHKARAPVWEKEFLPSLDWEEETILALQIMLGYLLSKSTDEEKMALFAGKSRGGKGTIYQTFQELIGKNNIFTAKFVEAGGDFGLQSLPGKRLWVIGDAHKGSGEKADIALERLKSIVGNDPVTIARKYSPSLENVHLPVKVLLLCNDIPQFIDSSGAFFNRTRLFQFLKEFTGKNEDTALKKKLRGELSGILNWCLDGLAEYRSTKKLIQPKQFAGALEDMRRATNPIQSFIQDMLLIQGEHPGVTWDHFVTSEEANNGYNKWCDANGRSARGNDRFINSLKLELGNRVEYKQIRIKKDIKKFGENPKPYVFLGMRLKDSRERKRKSHGQSEVDQKTDSVLSKIK